MRLLVCVVGILAVWVVSCGPRPEPTIDAAQVQASAAAIAATMMALTREAIPPTAIPSDTPQPSATPLPIPTLGFIAPLESPTATSQSGVDNCLHPIAMDSAGPKHNVLVQNQTGGTISLSLNLYKINAFGQCGAISYGNMSKTSSFMAGLPSGYWYAYAWGVIKGKNFKTSGSFFVQPAMFDKIELCVREANIVYKPQC